MVQPRLLAILSEQLYYDEIAIPFTRMQNECKQLIALLADSHIDVQDRINCSVFTIDQANELVRPPAYALKAEELRLTLNNGDFSAGIMFSLVLHRHIKLSWG